jgi:hypothetical protein
MSDPAPAPRTLRFDIFELDLRAGELRKRGLKLRLQGQPLSVLATLLQRAGDLVTREELRAQVWPADTFVDFDHSLHNAIARLRETLGDSAETPPLHRDSAAGTDLLPGSLVSGPRPPRRSHSSKAASPIWASFELSPSSPWKISRATKVMSTSQTA